MNGFVTHPSELDRALLPDEWPTHRCPPEFWEDLGRTLAKLGFLEDCLKRAYLAITATRKYDSVEEAQAAFDAWERDLVLSLDETLGHLAKRVVAALAGDERYPPAEINDIAEDLKCVSNWRNALCHGAWTDYDAQTRRATLRHWPRGAWDEQSERMISRDDLAKIGRSTVDLTVRVINAVTRRGIQFPGSTSPGAPVLSSEVPG